MSNSATRWCFTSYDLSLLERLRNSSLEDDGVSYLAAQDELCPSTGRRHVQGFVVFASRKRLATCKRFLRDPAAHLEVARGSIESCIAYCTKDDTRAPDASPFVFGTPPLSRSEEKSSDLALAVRAIVEGQALGDVARAHPTAFVRNGRGLRELGMFHRRHSPNFSPVATCVYWGEAGSGKTRSVMEWAASAGLSVYWKTYSRNSPSWWDGYDSEPVILCDDFEGERSGCDVVEFLHLNHGYGHLRSWPVKGGFVKLDAVRFIIYTSNTPPCSWFSEMGKTEAVKRRIDLCQELKKDVVFTAPIDISDAKVRDVSPSLDSEPPHRLCSSTPLRTPVFSAYVPWGPQWQVSPVPAAPVGLPSPPIPLHDAEDFGPLASLALDACSPFQL